MRPGRRAAILAAAFLQADAAGAILYAAALAGAATAAVSAGALTSRVIGFALLGVLAACLRGAAVWAQGLAGTAASVAARQALRRRLGSVLVARRFGGHAATDEVGTAMTVLADGVDSIDGYAARYVPARLAAVPTQLLVLVATAGASWFGALLLLGTLLPFVAMMALAGGAAADEARAQFAALSRLSGLFADRLRQLPLLLAFGAEGAEAARLGRAASDLHRRTMRVLRVAFISSAGLEFFAALSVALLAVYCGFALLGVLPFRAPEHLTLARALFVLVLAPEFYAPMRRLAAAYHDQQAAEAAADRMMELEAPAIGTTDAPAARIVFASPPRIRFDGATVRYPRAERLVLDGFDLDVAAGEMVALFGPSGAGKSTVINLLLGLAPLVGGEVWIDDVPLTGLGDVAGSASWMGQNSFLLPDCVAENIALSWPEATETDLRRVAIEAGLAAAGSSLAADAILHRKLDERGGLLSGGERRRVALARALLKPAPILLLDEPTAHLDADSERRLIEAIRRGAVGRTTIIVTHSAALAQAADRVVRLDLP